MSEAFDLTTYYAKRIIGDTAASDAENALLQTGVGIAGDTWILHRDDRTSKKYGIKYAYDSSGADKIEYYGKNANDGATAWIQLNTGDASFYDIYGNSAEIKNNITVTSKGRGLYLTDGASNQYAGIYDNATNLWIGATSATGQHHKGNTYISAGHNGTTGNKSIYISIPANGNASTTHTSYALVYKDATGNSTTPIYVNADGKTVACNDYTTLFTKLSWTAGNSSGPVLDVTIGGTNKTATIPSASATASGIVTTGSQTFSGIKKFYRESTTEQNYAAGIQFENKDTTTGQTQTGGKTYIYAYNTHAAEDNGMNMVIRPGGNLFVGGGESAGNLYATLTTSTAENLYLTADSIMYLEANANTIANRIGIAISTSGHILPQKAEAANNNKQNIGASDNKFANIYATTFIGALNGNADTATKLYTARSLWGNSFNGTADIGGTLTPDGNRTRDIGSDTAMWNNIHTRAIAARHIDAADQSYITDGQLHIGYGSVAPTKAIYLYYSADTSSRTKFFEVNSNGAYAATRFGVNGQNTSYNLYVNGTEYVTGKVYFSGDGIYHVGTAATQRIIRIIDANDQYGTGVSIGAGGLAILGSGESANKMIDNLGYVGGSEVTVISSDGYIYFYPTQNDAYDAASCISMTQNRLFIGVNGNTTRESGLYVQSGAGQIELFSAASATGTRGLWVAAHGTGSSKTIISADTNNNITYAGGAISGQLTRAGVAKSWYQGRDSAIIKTTSYSGYDAILSMKTTAGDWALGVYNDNIMYFTYILDSNYSSNSNTVTKQFIFNPNGTLTATTFSGALSGNASTATKFNSTRTIKLTGAVTGSATTDGGSGWEIATTKNHTHPISEVTWGGGQNLTCTPTANNQEYSIDLGNAYTGTYWHVWSAKNGASILQCYNDTRYVYVPVHLAVGGYDNTSYALSTNSFICNSWVRTKGSTGWRNEDYGGGWYMSDSSWIRSYNNKSVYVNTGDLRCDGSTWGAKLRMTDNWLGFYAGKGDATTRYGYIQCNADRMYFRKENSTANLTYYFDFGNTVQAPTFRAGNDNATYSSDRCKVYAANGTIGIHSSTNRGLYEFTDSKWIIYLQHSDDTVRSSYKIYGAVWNDFAEMREGDITEGGYAVYDDGHGHMKLCTERLQPGARLTSDTFGIVVGHTETAKTPIGVAGRVLVYPAQDRINYKVGDAVCAAPGGKVDLMTREEIMMYPERILGIVSEIPDYEVWNQRYKVEEEKEYTETNIQVNGRIWIYVR